MRGCFIAGGEKRHSHMTCRDDGALLPYGSPSREGHMTGFSELACKPKEIGRWTEQLQTEGVAAREDCS